MATRKEVSKIKQDWIKKRNDAINSKINLLEENIYDSLIPDFLAYAKSEEIRKQSNKSNVEELNKLERAIKKGFVNGFPDVMRETMKASKALGDLNLMYFSTLMESNRLDEIHEKTNKIIDKRLGLDENGKIKPNGFIDKTIKDTTVQKEFIREVKRIVGSNGDTQMLQNRLKTLVLSSPERNGLVQQYYNSFANNILNTIDRSNSNIYAEELELEHFYFGGGLIKSSRKFCIFCNGKIFTRDLSDKWRDKLGKPDGPAWDESRDGKYIPLEHMGGHGCLHTPDWITPELAKGNTREQNATATERNDKFKERHGL